MEEPNDRSEQHGDGPPPLVSLCVITFRRPKGLRRLVRSLARLEFRSNPARIQLNVVDNDAAGSAEAVCAKLSREVSFPIKYAVEPRRGIPFARNRSVRMIDRNSEFVVFVDDDETVAATWLDELLRVQRACDADVVSGPVLPDFLAPPPHWIVKGAFFEPQRYRTGEQIQQAYTNNTLVRVALLERMDSIFDERLVFTGGSDTHFFLRLFRAGYKLVWADRAVVYDCIPASRMNTPWLLQRAYRQGVMTAFVARDLRRAPGQRALQMGAGASRIARGVLLLPISWLFGWHRFVDSLRCACFTTGLLAGLLGLRYQEYRSRHGT